MRIAIAGFQHETNTFAPKPTKYDDFVMTDSWPGMLHGDMVMSETRGMNLPITGAINSAEAFTDHHQDRGQDRCIDLIPLLWCSAEPGGYVSDDAFDRIASMICDSILASGQIDGIYLDLHGAMVTASHFDGEGELLRRIRAVIGDNIPIAVSLDLHANVTHEMVNYANLITIYRTYPHLDMAATGGRAMDGLLDILSDAEISHAFRQIPFLIPLPAQYTGADPCLSIYKHMSQISSDRGAFVEWAMGFSASDIPDCGPSVLAYAPSSERADAMVADICDRIMAAEADFDPMLIDPEPAGQIALNSSSDNPGAKPVVLADVQDTPGAGGSGDTAGLLKALYHAGAEGAVCGIISDPDFTQMAHQAGIWAHIKAGLGGKSGVADDTPFEAEFIIHALHDGIFTYTGEMYGGGIAEIGDSCLVSPVGAADIKIVVSTYRTQCLDQCFFTSFGIDLTATRIIALKSTVHFRADFEPLASQIIHVAAPGLFECRLERLPYQHLRDGVRWGQ